MAKTTTQVRAKVKKKPVKAGSTKPRNIGGIVNYKVVLIRNKMKDDQKHDKA